MRPGRRPEPDEGRDPAGPQGGHRIVGEGDRDDLGRRGHDPDQGDDEEHAVAPVRGRLGLERPAGRAPRADRRDRERDDRQDRDRHDEPHGSRSTGSPSGDEPPDGAGEADDDDRRARSP